MTRHTANTGTIYLLHFDRPYRHAAHYSGFTTNLLLAASHGGHERPSHAIDLVWRGLRVGVVGESFVPAVIVGTLHIGDGSPSTLDSAWESRLGAWRHRCRRYEAMRRMSSGG
jgi:hypothetical protein